MIKRKILFHKQIMLLFMGMSIFLLSACGSRESKDNEAVVKLLKDGTVSTSIEEAFNKEYYDQEELKQTILKEVSDYNKGNAAGSISVEKIDVQGGQAIVQMTYKTARDFAAFNEVDFFAGPADQAKEAGYGLNVVLSSVKDEQDTIGEGDILSLNGYKILITDIADQISLNGRAVYVSENIAVSKDLKLVYRAEGMEGMAYIIYK